ncbi:MAG: BON domain-containing protein [Pirellulaceae bacterium]|nr:BON domain-containing protein [Pirellulaceae bacterium]
MRRVLVGMMFGAMLLVPTIVSADDNQIVEGLVAKVQASKAAGELRGFDLDLQVEQGIVTMQGQVATLEQKNLLIDHARTTPGVTKIMSGLRVKAVSEGAVLANTDLPKANPAKLSGIAGLKNMFGSTAQPAKTTRVVPASAEAQLRSVVSNADAPARLPEQVETAPVYAGAERPLAFAPSTRVASAGAPIRRTPAYNYGGAAHGGVHGPRAFHGRYEQAHMPRYAWPTYAAYPNYAAVGYPTQYSAGAYPCIGPFYPYPQVPLGWRKVTLEWDDGYWWLDFKDR